MIKRAYVLGVRDALIERGVVKYATEEEANQDAGIMSEALEQAPVGGEEMAEDEVQPEATATIAAAVVNMAQEAGQQAEAAKAKADIAADAAAELAKTGALKIAAAAPGDDNVVAGHNPGSVAAGESSAKADDHKKELASAVPNTAEREDYFGSPGHQADEDEGHIGDEGLQPDAEGTPGIAGLRDLNKELASAVPNTADREDYHGGPGEQADEGKGTIGTEKISNLYDRLSRL